MVLNWKTVKENMSVIDIENYIIKHQRKLKITQIKLLQARIEQMKEENKIAIVKLLKSKIMRMAVYRTIEKTREIQDLTPIEVIMDKRLCDRFWGVIIDNMKEIRDRLNVIEHSKNNLCKRWKSERGKN